MKMSPRVRQAKFRNAFSSTALGSDMSRKVVDWAWSFMNWPDGRSVDLIWRRSPGSSARVWSICHVFCNEFVARIVRNSHGS